MIGQVRPTVSDDRVTASFIAVMLWRNEPLQRERTADIQ